MVEDKSILIKDMEPSKNFDDFFCELVDVKDTYEYTDDNGVDKKVQNLVVRFPLENDEL